MPWLTIDTVLQTYFVYISYLSAKDKFKTIEEVVILIFLLLA